MKTSDVIEAFGGTQVAAAKALGIEQPSIARWGDEPPALRQIQIERLTCGRLRAESWCWEIKPSEKAAA